MEIKAFNHLKDKPNESSRVQLNEDTEFLIEQNPASMNSKSLLNHENSFSGINSMLRENPAQFPTCVNLLGNLDGKSQLHGHDMVDNNDYAVTRAPMFNNVLIPQNSRSSLDTENSMTAGVRPQSLYGEATLTSHFNDDTVSFEDAMAFSSLYGNIHGPLVDNTLNNGGPAELPQFLTGSVTTESGSDHVRISKENCDSFTNSAFQINSFQTPQTTRKTRSIGGKTADRVVLHSQGGTSTGTPQVRGVNSNGEIRFTALFNNSTSSQTEKNSVSIGSIPNITRRNNRSDVSIGTSHIQDARTNSDNSMGVATHFHGLQRPQINSSSIRFGGETTAVIQPTSQGERLTGRFHVGTITIDDDDNEESVSTFSNLQGQQVNNSLEGALVSRSSLDSQDKTIDGTNLASNGFFFEGVQDSMADRNFLSVGSDTPEVQQSQIHKQSMTRNNVKANANQSNNGSCSEQIDSSFLNLGFGGNTNVGLGSNGFGGPSSYNEFPVTTQSGTSHEPDWNFLSLGGNLVDQTWSNNRNTIISGTNAGAISSPYTSLGGNMENQTWSNNVSRMISGSHAGVSNPFTSLQTVRGNGDQYVQRPSGTTLETRGVAGMNAYTVPCRGFHGHSGMALRPPNSTSTGLHATEQARLSSLPVGPNFFMGIPNRPFPSSLQRSYMESVRNFSTNSAMASSLTSTATRNFQLDQSGHPVPANVPIAEASRGIAQVANNSKHVHSGQAAAHICRRGKRVPADGVQYNQSAKVHLRPSATGKPVPVAGHAGLTQPSEGLIAQSIHSSVPYTSTTLRTPRARRIHKSPINPPVTFGSQATKIHPSSLNPSTGPGSQPNTAHYLKWKGPEDVFHSSGENCHLCKRDLTYTPTGAVTQPSVPPAVAVLPCGHTFHDECLQLITPEDQLKSPPCIPCAIGNF